MLRRMVDNNDEKKQASLMDVASSFDDHVLGGSSTSVQDSCFGASTFLPRDPPTAIIAGSCQYNPAILEMNSDGSLKRRKTIGNPLTTPYIQLAEDENQEQPASSISSDRNLVTATVFDGSSEVDRKMFKQEVATYIFPKLQYIVGGKKGVMPWEFMEFPGQEACRYYLIGCCQGDITKVEGYKARWNKHLGLVRKTICNKRNATIQLIKGHWKGRRYGVEKLRGFCCWPLLTPRCIVIFQLGTGPARVLSLRCL